MKLRQKLWKLKDKFIGKTHKHTRENARRKRQIEKGILTKSNGLKIQEII